MQRPSFNGDDVFPIGRNMKYQRLGFCALAIAAYTAPVQAVVVPNGTVSAVGTFNPTINIASSPSTFSAMSGGTIEVSGSGGFTSAMGGAGTINGILSFSTVVGTTIAQAISNFFVFADGSGGTYNYSVASVTTNAFVDQGTTAQSGTLYLLGNIVDSMRVYDTPTSASLTVQFNSTGGSPFATSATLAVPAAGSGAVPEPASWAMMVVGFGMLGAVMRQRKVAVSFR